MMVRALALMALALGAAPLAAQQGGGMRGGGMMMGAAPDVEQLTTALALTPEQVTKAKMLVATLDSTVKPTRDWVQAQMQTGGMAAMRDNPTARDSMMKMRTARTMFDAEFKKLLTPEQVTKYDAWLAEQRPRRPMGGGN